MTSFRLASGGLVDRTRTLSFSFDGRAYTGHPGDTLASALLANGVRLVARSFKLHRPRGIVTAGPEEPSALVTIGTGGRQTPNVPATTVELVDGLVAASQNRWPSLETDVLALNGLFARLLPAGFYYKTFMWPASFWEKVYEPAIRRAAGLGTIASTPDPDHDEIVHAHCDVLVVGAGVAGLAAAVTLRAGGIRVRLLEQDTIAGVAAPAWSARAMASIGSENVQLRTTVVGAYGQGVFAAVERVADHAVRGPALRHRLHIIRARCAILATGATERLIAFPGNDRPGVMLADAGRTYAERYGVAVGRRVVVFASNDRAYATARRLADAGVEIAAIVDPRPWPPVAAHGLKVLSEHEVSATGGGRRLTSVRVRRRGRTSTTTIDADTLLVSGGFSPNVQLASQAGAKLIWNGNAFVPIDSDGDIGSAGAARGVFGSAAAAADGETLARRILARLGRTPPATSLSLPQDDEPSDAAPFWHVNAAGKAFVDLQHDVTTDDVRLAAREGYTDVEHMKRYTTHGMGTDQGRIGGLVGSAVLAEARGLPIADVGLPKFRPYTQPVAFGALAGADVGAHFKPVRRLPLHHWHAANGASFVRIGLWLRPLVYSSGTSWAPVLEEARHVRRAVGLSDASSLGKIDVQGPDAGRFLDRLYINTVSTLPVGRTRYGVMLREDGMVLDDGTLARLADQHFLVTTTTQKADDVLAHMEWYHQTVWPDLEVALTNVADQWAQFAVAGPFARRVVGRVVEGLALDDQAFPFMACTEAVLAGRPGRLFRISFSGEQAYELAVPATYADHLWQALLDTGRPDGIRPYGLDALNVLRIEKGHVTGAEINGQTTAADLGLARMAKKSGDFVGRVLSQREGLQDPGRLQLVGLTARDPTQRIRGGSHLVATGSTRSQGYITSACMAAEGEGWIALGLLAGGHGRHGEEILATSPVFGEDTRVTVTSPHKLDPENARVKG